MDELTPRRPVEIVTASELAREGARIRERASDGWVLVTRRGRPIGAVVGLASFGDLVDWSDPARFVSARDLNRTGAVSDVLDAVEAGEARVLTEHNRPVAAIVSAEPFVEQLRRAVAAALRSDADAGGGTSATGTPWPGKGQYQGLTSPRPEGWQQHGPSMPT